MYELPRNAKTFAIVGLGDDDDEDKHLKSQL